MIAHGRESFISNKKLHQQKSLASVKFAPMEDEKWKYKGKEKWRQEKEKNGVDNVR